MTRSGWKHDRYLDARGLACPLPVLMARKALAELEATRRLLVDATDPLAAIDIPHLVAERGDRLVATETANGVYRCLIERA